ncbi:MAG: LysR family transcriptional regulator [Bryobacteraceae bacterium]
MTLDHILLFRDIAASRSISKASELNEISQSAASQHLQELERQWGVELVDRTTRPIALTPAGRRYYEFCRETARLYQEFQDELEQLKGSTEGRCRVASIYSVGLSELVSLERIFRQWHPESELDVQYLQPARVYEAILADRADLGLVSYPEPRRELTLTPWRNERMMAAMCPGHRLAGRPEIRAEDLAGEDFIGFDPDLPVSREVRRYLREAGVEVELVTTFDNIQSMKEAVTQGHGLSLLPEPILRPDLEQRRLVAIPLAAPGLFRPLGIVRLKRKRLNRASESFLSLLTGAAKTLRATPSPAGPNAPADQGLQGA